LQTYIILRLTWAAGAPNAWRLNGATPSWRIAAGEHHRVASSWQHEHGQLSTEGKEAVGEEV